AGLICIPWTLITRNADFMYHFALGGVCMALRLVGIRVQVEGLDALDRGRTYIFMSNHVSNLDPPILVPVIPRRTSVLVKKELFRVPILGRAMRLASLVPVDRSNRDAAIASLRAAADDLTKGIPMTIFVEGTRSFDGRLLPFKKGPFYLAMESAVPVVPVTIVGTHYLLPKRRFGIRGGGATVVFHPPLDPKQFSDRDALLSAVHASIESALPAEYRQVT
ncbi:MAG TPA: lysophospholipid acyltransferase family protein, partial [Terriglobales bacterium]|nr:lysophospholipid acyltransferase family protein [Terriglobales bacterium]